MSQEIYYCYLYRDICGTPIYIGKGKGKRAFTHMKNSSNNQLNNTLKKRLRDGFIIEPEFLYKDVDEEFALFVEIEMIRHYGRKDLKTGTLFNLTDGGDGVVGILAPWNKGKSCSVEHRANMSKSRIGNTNNLGLKHTIEHCINNGKSKANTVTCFNLITKEIKRVASVEFHSNKGILYVGMRSKEYKNFKEVLNG